MKTIEETRELIKKYEDKGGSIVKNKKSGKYSLILNNNVKYAGNQNERFVVFMPLKGVDFFCMERDRFYSEFECAFNDDKAIEELMNFLNKMD